MSRDPDLDLDLETFYGNHYLLVLQVLLQLAY